jgi:16S rRNA (guanine966-N2)-methyltransferase
MKISGGTSKGRSTVKESLVKKLSSAKKLRPTSSKVREAIFDILRSRIEGASFIDLYAGTGTVGFEALSRGAIKAVFVEQDDIMVNEIVRNAVALGFMGRVNVVRADACTFLSNTAEGEKFDIFFVDPPYWSEEIVRVLPLISGEELLTKDGIVVVEHFFKKRLPESVDNLRMQNNYRYGDTMLSFYGKAAA